ncbi:MAG: undecaprenyldiphospho-muramoylpentapeptide beta-N-acetylglucosaminyltransferase [Alphaproteobacteria bacterium]|nr:undecaprenyldiphospho-muramoylpentapeptide beta-N-acetylglucosaminyltransferase [Alphaproteobacteria bacterium]MCY4318951.1 undecaprenyldiphospho-muramoylpentapeptide beta-N-acetylglucosaminyltransferase [Alphaproteobacteria bacterium]
MVGPIAIAAGGTGGHVFPARAFAACLAARSETAIAVTDRRGTAFAGDAPVYTIRAGSPRSPSGLMQLGLGVFDARRVLAKTCSRAVVGFGGYPSAPTVLAARWLGLTTVLHEQNAVLGRTNRVLARGRVKIAAGYPGLGDRLVGNPVRAEIAALRERAYVPPAPSEPLRLLVFGGSQGARLFSEILPAALGPLAGRVALHQQCRAEDLEVAREAYRRQGVEARLEPFIEDMANALGMAHLVIARAGASTVAELSAAGRPAILVPYPHATDDHQSANARAVVEAGGGWLLQDRDFTPDRLRQLVETCLAEPGQLAQAAAAARCFGRPDAAGALVDFVLSQMREATP